MKWKGLTRGWTAILCSFVLIGAGAVLVTPAANALSSINWGSIWKHQLQPRADKRYYTKAQAKKTFAPAPKVIRGAFSILGKATATNDVNSDNISFGVTLSAAPTVHYIDAGAAVPPGCSGTVSKPNAAPGNLCVFEAETLNVTNRNTYATTGTTPGIGQCTAFGCGVYAQATAAGNMYAWGTWAVRPVALSSSKVPASPTAKGGTFGR
jgi:hypothetical protein